MLRPIVYCAVFLLNVALLTRIRTRSVRQVVLLISSYLLYISWGAWFAAILVASTVINFFLGEWLRRKPAKSVLTTGILLNLALLASFKYLPDVAVNLPFSSLQKFAHLALPLGISFWTFQAMSYLFDLYREEELKPSFIEFALYMAFFPVAISGPICRMPDMLPQFRCEELTSKHDLGRGFARIATGFLMMQLARVLGQGILSGDGINSAFDHHAHWSGADVWCLGFGFGLQLFFDFAGYSHIAIGAGQCLGFVLPENFERPFLSTTPSLFWTRWHMSLSFWIRDYVFLPLAMMRREIWWRNMILVLSMVLFGIWHRATLLFLLWGCYHGLLLVLHRQFQQVQHKMNWTPPSAIWTSLSWLTTICLVSLGWIFFRANSLPQALQMFGAVFSPVTYSTHLLTGSLYLLVFALAGGYAAVLFVCEFLDRYEDESGPSAIATSIARHRWYWIPPIYALSLVVVLIVTHTQGAFAGQFMYRRF